MATAISRLVKTLEGKYNSLSEKEADYLAASDSRCGCGPLMLQNTIYIDSQCLFKTCPTNCVITACKCIGASSLEDKKNAIMTDFAEVTKADVTLNNYLTRSKNLFYIFSNIFCCSHFMLMSLYRNCCAILWMIVCFFASFLLPCLKEHQVGTECEGQRCCRED